MSKPGPKRTQIQIKRDRREIADLYLKGWLQSAIAESINKDPARAYTLTRQMISYDLIRLQKQWQESTLLDVSKIKAKELAKIDRLEREYWDAWERSKEKEETTITEKVDDAKGGHTKAQLKTIGQVGDSRFLKGVEWCIEKRIKIFGLEAPVQLEVADVTELRITEIVVEVPGDVIEGEVVELQGLEVLEDGAHLEVGEPEQ